jgi:hypothetical protein
VNTSSSFELVVVVVAWVVVKSNAVAAAVANASAELDVEVEVDEEGTRILVVRGWLLYGLLHLAAVAVLYVGTRILPLVSVAKARRIMLPFSLSRLVDFRCGGRWSVVPAVPA